jgi:hypothetical protein
MNIKKRFRVQSDLSLFMLLGIRGIGSIFAEFIRKSVEAPAIPHSESGIEENVTVSPGVVTVNTSSLFSPEQSVHKY